MSLSENVIGLAIRQYSLVGTLEPSAQSPSETRITIHHPLHLLSTRNVFKNLCLGFGGGLIDTSAYKAGVEKELEDCGSEFGNTAEC